MVEIARALNFSLNWFLNGPDVSNMGDVPPFENSITPGDYGLTPANDDIKFMAKEPEADSRYELRAVAHQLIDAIDDAGLVAIIETLKIVAAANPKKLPNSPDSGITSPTRAA